MFTSTSTKTQITQQEQMFKRTNHLASPRLLITSAGLLAPNQLEVFQEQPGVRDTQVGLFSVPLANIQPYAPKKGLKEWVYSPLRCL